MTEDTLNDAEALNQRGDRVRPTWTPNAWPTAEEFRAWYINVPEWQQTEIAAKLITDAQAADQCWMARHEERLHDDTARLTEEERAERRCNCDFCYWDEHYTRAAVEAIVAARTAALARDRDALAAKITRVEALRDEVENMRVALTPFAEYVRLGEVLALIDAALAGPEDTARDTQRDDEGSGL